MYQYPYGNAQQLNLDWLLNKMKHIYDKIESINTHEKELATIEEVNILVVGNSFNQDAFAYLPPVLSEMLPEYKINFCVLYASSADFSTHINYFQNDLKYTKTNIWNHGDSAWTRLVDSGGFTLTEALNYKKWHMIFTQATTSDVQNVTRIQNKIITDGRKLLRILQNYAQAPFNAYYIEWMARPDDNNTIDEQYVKIHEALIPTLRAVGFSDYAPVGTAFQNARTNATFNALGAGGNMLFSDRIHMQAGLPALLATYVLADFIASKLDKNIYCFDSAFTASTDAATAINATMTHGTSTEPDADQRRAAQEIAAITMANPDTVVDTSSIIIQTPD